MIAIADGREILVPDMQLVMPRSSPEDRLVTVQHIRQSTAITQHLTLDISLLCGLPPTIAKAAVGVIVTPLSLFWYLCIMTGVM
jgi:hypothetical protein